MPQNAASNSFLIAYFIKKRKSLIRVQQVPETEVRIIILTLLGQPSSSAQVNRKDSKIETESEITEFSVLIDVLGRQTLA